jgi:proteasome lid subunit RPN8/RPN11
VYELTTRSLNELLANVRGAYPKEACGALIGTARGRATRLSVVPTSSEENTPISFIIRDRALRSVAESLGPSSTICGCFHSHVLGFARPSKRDCAADKSTGDIWLIYSIRFQDVRLFTWDGARFNRTRFRVVATA